MIKLVCALLFACSNALMAQPWRGYEEDEYYDEYGGDSSGEFWFYPPAVIATIIIYLIIIARGWKEEAGKNKKPRSGWGYLVGGLFVFPFVYAVIYLPVIFVGAVLKYIFL